MKKNFSVCGVRKKENKQFEFYIERFYLPIGNVFYQKVNVLCTFFYLQILMVVPVQQEQIVSLKWEKLV